MNHGVLDRVITHALGDAVHAYPASARADACMFLADTLAVAISGARLADTARLLVVAQAAGQGGDARALGLGTVLPAPQAAMVNAFAIHNQEYDAVHEGAVVHPFAVIVAVLLAVAERRGVAGQPVEGRAFVDAMLVAVDIAATAGLAARSPMRFFRPAMAGALGALGGAARLAGAGADALARAYGLLLAQLSGTMQAHVEGTPGLALQVAVNARAAVTALDMAVAGLAGPRDVFEGAYGYHALIDGDWSTDPYATLGSVVRISEVSHKPFPTGRAAHAALDALEQLVTVDGLTANDVAAVVLQAPPLVRRLVGRAAHPAMTPSWARLCLPYLVARRLRHGPIGVTAFEPACFADPLLHALAAGVRWEPNGVDDPNALVPQTLRVACRDGRVLERRLDAVLGAPAARLGAAAQRAKFEHCLDHAPRPWTPDQRQRLADTVAAVETLGDIRQLVDACL